MASFRHLSRCWLSILMLANLTYLPACLAEGGISLSHTRVIFDSKAQNAKVTLINNSHQVYLINSKVQQSADEHISDAKKMPFMVVPPLFRLEKESRNVLLITRNDTSALPSDRESVFYLNVLAIPSVPKNGPKADNSEWSQPQVSFGIRNIIKLFYRPAGLNLSNYAAAEKLTFIQQGAMLQVSNPTPYYQTLGLLSVDGKPVDVREYGAMIAPFSEMRYPVSGSLKRVRWAVIDDYGSLTETLQWSR